MAQDERKKFATRVDAQLLADLRALARTEGRQLQSLVDEALGELLEKRRQERPRAHAMAAHARSHERHGSLYEKLAE